MRNFLNFMVDRGVFILLATILCIGAVLYANIRMNKFKDEMEEYFLAKTCPNEENCREKIEARVVRSFEKSITFMSVNKHGRSSSGKDVTYQVIISLNHVEYDLEISPNPPSNGTPFDINDVRIPSGQDTLFVEGNFYKNQKVYIEIWQKKITMIYLDKYIDVPDGMIQPMPSLDTQTTIKNNPLPNTYEIAIPTTIHPIFQQASTEKDFFSTTIICSFLLVIIYGTQFENIKRLIKSMSKQKKNDRKDTEESI